jgi:hypothetical protein
MISGGRQLHEGFNSPRTGLCSAGPSTSAAAAAPPEEDDDDLEILEEPAVAQAPADAAGKQKRRRAEAAEQGEDGTPRTRARAADDVVELD